MRIAVTGISGNVGSFVTGYLLRSGHDVVGLTRRLVPQWTADGTGTLLQIQGSLAGAATEARLWNQLLSGVDACVHCAFEHVPGRYRGGEGDDPAAFWHLNLNSTLQLLEACERYQIQRCVLLSSRAVFDGYDHPVRLSDTAALRPTTHYGALKAAEEALAQRYSAQTAVACPVLRATGVYGVREPPSASKWFTLLGALDRGELPVARCASEVHGEDLAAAVVQLLTAADQQIRGRGFNCAAQLVSHRDLVAQYNALRGRNLPLPERGPEPRVQLDCGGLRDLGWHPDGAARLDATLRRLLGAAPH